MCSVTVFVLLTCTVVPQELRATRISDMNESMDEVPDQLVGKLVNRALKVWPLHGRDLDNMTLGKPGNIALRARPVSPGTGHGSWVRGAPWSGPVPSGAIQPLQVAFSSFSLPPFLRKTSSEIPKIIGLIEDSKRGVDSSFTSEIVSCMKLAAEEQKGDPTRLLAGEWDLMWTNKNEFNFFYTWPFARPERIVQAIDVESMTIETIIPFEGGGQLKVSGIIEGFENSKCFFKFKTACVKAYGGELSIPFFESGFFETLYVDDRWRVGRLGEGEYFFSERAR